MKGSKKNNKRSLAIICAVGALCLLIVAGIVLWICLSPDGNDDEKKPDDTQNTVETGESAGFKAIDIGEGLFLASLADSKGAFPEKGATGDVRESMLCATFENRSDRTLQYAKVTVTVGEVEYSFEFSTIPAGKSVYAFEMNGARGDGLEGDVSAEAEYLVFFPQEPTLLESDLEITVKDGAISIKNISGKDIDREISVFYKNTLEGFYLGGITYRVRLAEGLKAGESVNGYASHAREDATEVMFCQYGA